MGNYGYLDGWNIFKLWQCAVCCVYLLFAVFMNFSNRNTITEIIKHYPTVKRLMTLSLRLWVRWLVSTSVVLCATSDLLMLGIPTFLKMLFHGDSTKWFLCILAAQFLWVWSETSYIAIIYAKSLKGSVCYLASRNLHCAFSVKQLYH